MPHGEPTPWTLGMLVWAACATLGVVLLLGVYALLGQRHRGLGLGAVVILAPCLGVTLWGWRQRPVWRWIVWGAVVGLLAGAASVVVLFAFGESAAVLSTG
ncbi:MAG: DUF2537 domain-containing protein [Gordonia sp. (in: high G+C Gram-positive bacteria)]